MLKKKQLNFVSINLTLSLKTKQNKTSSSKICLPFFRKEKNKKQNKPAIKKQSQLVSQLAVDTPGLMVVNMWLPFGSCDRPRRARAWLLIRATTPLFTRYLQVSFPRQAEVHVNIDYRGHWVSPYLVNSGRVISRIVSSGFARVGCVLFRVKRTI